MRVALVAVILLIAVNFAILGMRSTTNGPAAPQRPEAIVDLSPEEGQLQLPQAPIEVDLRTDYTGQLTIDNHLIPDDQITGDPNLGQVIFEPGPSKDFTQLRRGAHSAVIEYWPKTVRNVEAARKKRLAASYSWAFKTG